jgi:hypothetical protein
MLSIGELSRATDCKVETIRYYEKIGPDAGAGAQCRQPAALRRAPS